MWKIIAEDICHKFNQRKIFEGISFDISSGQSMVLTGANGSGKTTLVRIICHLIRPQAGNITFSRDNKEIVIHHIYPHIGLVGPYLQLYVQLTAFENYKFFAKIHGLKTDLKLFKSLMEKMGLAGRELDELRTYSSGMMQRAKYVMALIHQPHILILDEPSVNLDESGATLVYDIMAEQKKDKILILATNEPEEFKFGDEQISLDA
jgi:heme exporter protein A